MFAREADEAYPLGPASARPYIDLAVLERVLVACGADAVWVGWGFVAEDPAFADLCARLGVTFIGPSAEAMRKLGDKIGSKLLAEEVGVPVAPWSRGGVDTLEAALASATEIGYPLMLKATAGGGGRGIRKVDTAAELEDAYQRTRDEAERAFGSGVVFLERLVTGARHVEVQLIADGHGTAWAVGVRDCTIQRRNQKVIEESASPLLDPDQTDEVKASAERLAVAVGYVGAGTVEFLYHPGERTFAFLEVNTRLQVEHPITEVTTDLDLVKAAAARGGRRQAGGHQAAREGARGRGPAQRRGPGPRLRSVAGPDRSARAAVGAGRARRHRRRRGRHHPRRLRLDDRQDHRLRPHPRRGAGPAAPRDGRDHRGDRGWRHQQELHPRPARPVRGHRRQGRLGRHQLDRPGPCRGPAGQPRALRRRRGRRRDRGLRGRGPGRDRPPARERARRPPAGAAQGRAGGRLQAAGYGVQGHRHPDRTAALPGARGRGRRGAHGGGRRRAARRVPHADDGRRPALSAGDRHARTRAPGRGQRCGPPGQPRRGRCAAFARARPGGRLTRRSRRHRRRRRAGAGAREHEDGDGAAGTVRRQGARAAGDDRQPGRDRCAAGAARAVGRRRRRRPGRARAGRPGARPAACSGRRLRAGSRRAQPGGRRRDALRLRHRPPRRGHRDRRLPRRARRAGRGR